MIALYVLVMRSWAGALVVDDGVASDVGIDPSAGLVVQLPQFVQMVTPSTEFVVEPVSDPKDGVKHLRVAARPGAKSAEVVTFVLADGQAVMLRFVPGEGAGADGFVAVQMREVETPGPDLWMGPERALLTEMFADGPNGRRVDEEVEYEAYPELLFHLIRVHQGPRGLVGYTFEVINQTSDSIRLHPEVLSVGWPNRAALVQVDHDILVSCDEAPAWEPDRPSCRTALRMVVRSERGAALGTSVPRMQSEQPFVMVVSKKKGRK